MIACFLHLFRSVISVRQLGALLALGLFASGGGPLCGAPDTPAWIDVAVAAARLAEPNLPVLDTPSPATILSHEETWTVGDDGEWTAMTRRVVRIDDLTTRDLAYASAVYASDQRPKPRLEAWLISPDGTVKSYGKRQVVDRLADTSAFASALRALSIDASDDVQPGAIFAWQREVVTSPLFLQLYWQVQQEEPVLRWHLTLTLPRDWSAPFAVFNHPSVTPRRVGSTLIWEFGNLPGVTPEPAGLEDSDLAAFLAINLVPPENTRLRPNTRIAPATWADFSAYFSLIYDARTQPSVEVIAQARKLTADAGSQSLQTLAVFVQNLNYVSINLDPTRSSGIIPRDATETLATGYGDCKDKATLLRSLLRAKGIDSFAVLANTDDLHAARPDWPAIGAFNHCIIAVQVDDSVEAPAIVSHPRFGRLLFFDPTDEFTALGQLPAHLRGARVLLLAGPYENLIELPTEQPDENRTDRKVVAEIAANGHLFAQVTETYVGAAASLERARRHHYQPDQYENWLTERLGSSMGSARLGELSTDEGDENQFRLAVQVSAAAYAKTMRDQYLIVKPVVVARRIRVGFDPGAERTQPIRLGPASFAETTRIAVPPGFTAVELPPDVTLVVSWARYSATCRFEGRELIHERRFDRDAVVLPADSYDAFCRFRRSIVEAEQTPALLERRASAPPASLTP